MRSSGLASGTVMVSVQDLTAARILIVDDQAANVRLLERLLGAHGFIDTVGTTDPLQVRDLFRATRPDLVILDLHMPRLDGFGVMAELSSDIAAERFLPILVLTADALSETRQRALRLGAKDFLSKPFDSIEVLLRVRNLLETRFRYRFLEQHRRELEQRVLERTRELEDARFEVIDRLAIAAEYRDDHTGEHTRRVANVARHIAQSIGLAPGKVELVARAAPLHDVGKVGIPDSILLLPRTLNEQERLVIRTHTTIGARILSGSRVALLRVAQEIAVAHHERWDGTGYPNGLAHEEIPLAARIVCLADTFDAMTHPRRYKPTHSVDETLAYIRRERACHFDPSLADALLDTPTEQLRAMTGAH
ncbi:MAG: response regulator [Vicinamibacterales bacterium]